MRFERLLYQILLRVRSIFRRRQEEQELEAEFQFHLEEKIAQEVAAGKTFDAARYEALRAMQGLEQQKETCRDMRRSAIGQRIAMGENSKDDFYEIVGVVNCAAKSATSTR
jgi:hypothetical protein